MAESTDNVTILFVDDSITDRTRGVGLIRNRHPEWHVIPADDGHEALQILGNGNVNLVVSDLFMPGLDGRELLQKISTDHPLTPVILITSQGSDQLAAECVALGASNYVPKRQLAEQLVDAVDAVLKEEAEAAEMYRVLAHVVENHCAFAIDSELEQIRSLVNFVQKRLEAYRAVSSHRVHQVTTAVREALLNAHYHGNYEANSQPFALGRTEYVTVAGQKRQQGFGAGRKIHLLMSLHTQGISIHVRDDGPGFDTAAVAKQAAMMPESTVSGKGVALMRQYCSSVSFSPKGNEVTLTIDR